MRCGGRQRTSQRRAASRGRGRDGRAIGWEGRCRGLPAGKPGGGAGSSSARVLPNASRHPDRLPDHPPWPLPPPPSRHGCRRRPQPPAHLPPHRLPDPAGPRGQLSLHPRRPARLPACVHDSPTRLVTEGVRVQATPSCANWRQPSSVPPSPRHPPLLPTGARARRTRPPLRPPNHLSKSSSMTPSYSPRAGASPPTSASSRAQTASSGMSWRSRDTAAMPCTTCDPRHTVQTAPCVHSLRAQRSVLRSANKVGSVASTT